MNLNKVTEVEELSELEFTHHADKAAISTSAFPPSVSRGMVVGFILGQISGLGQAQVTFKLESINRYLHDR